MPGLSPSSPGDSLDSKNQSKPTDASLEVTDNKNQVSDSAHAHPISHPWESSEAFAGFGGVADEVGP